jgi:hypothetical protein
MLSPDVLKLKSSFELVDEVRNDCLERLADNPQLIPIVS